MHFNLNPEWDGVSLVLNLIVPGAGGTGADRIDGADLTFYAGQDQASAATRPDEPSFWLTPFQGMLLDNVQYAQAIDLTGRIARGSSGRP